MYKMSRKLFLQPVLIVLALLGGVSHGAEIEDIETLIEQERFRAALKDVDDVIKQAPDNPRPLFLKGLALSKLKRIDDAIAVYQQITVEFPNLPEPYNNLASLYMATGKLEDARIALVSALSTNDSYATAYKNLSSVYAQMASAAYRQALNSKSNSSAIAVLTPIDQLRSWQEPTPEPVLIAATNTGNTLIESDQESAATVNEPDTEVVDQEDVGIETENEPEAQAINVAALSSDNAENAQTTPNTIDTPDSIQLEEQTNLSDEVVSVTSTETTNDDLPTVENTTTAASEDNSVETETLIATVNNWAKAWSERKVDDYLSYYAADFVPDNPELNRTSWVEQRRGRLRWRKFIDVQVNEPTVLVNGTTAKVSFQQSYKSDVYQDQVNKTLSLKRVNEDWKIVREQSTDV